MDNEYRYFFLAQVGENLEPLMTADQPPGGLIPDQRLDNAQVIQRQLQTFIFGIAWTQLHPRIIVRRSHRLHRHDP